MNETLQSMPPYPLDRAFVLKLHRDADLRCGELCGRLVHVASDERIDFTDAESLRRAVEALVDACLPSIRQATLWPLGGP